MKDTGKLRVTPQSEPEIVMRRDLVVTRVLNAPVEAGMESLGRS
jgi:hypothetical protein